MEKVIVVGSTDLHTYFTSCYPNWDTQIPVEGITDVWDGLGSGKLSAESSIVVLTDVSFGDVGEYEASVEAVAAFSPEATVLVVFYDFSSSDGFVAAVSSKQSELGLPVSPFYCIDSSGNIGEEINNALSVSGSDVKASVVVDPAQPGVYSSIGKGGETFSYDPSRSGTRKGLIVASTSSKGGAGKTTVGMLVASMFYHASRKATEEGLRDKPLRVCVVDMDIRDGQVGFIIRKTSPTALNIFLEADKGKETILNNLVYDEHFGLSFLLAPKRARTADYLSPEFYSHVINQLAEEFDVVLLDTNVDYTNLLTSQVVLPISDAILFITNLTVGSVYGMNKWMDEVSAPAEQGGQGVSKNKIGVVVNMFAPGLGIDEELLKSAAAGAEVLTSIPMDSTNVISASNHGKLSDVILYHTKISPAYLHIVKQLLPNEVFGDPLIISDVDDDAQGSYRSDPSAPVVRKKKRMKLF